MDLSAAGSSAPDSRSRWQKGIDRLQQVPGLPTKLALAGTAVWMFLTVKALLALTGVNQIGLQVEAVADRTGAIELASQFFNQHWVLLFKCLAPSLVVALLVK